MCNEWALSVCNAFQEREHLTERKRCTRSKWTRKIHSVIFFSFSHSAGFYALRKLAYVLYFCIYFFSCVLHFTLMKMSLYALSITKKMSSNSNRADITCFYAFEVRIRFIRSCVRVYGLCNDGYHFKLARRVSKFDSFLIWISSIICVCVMTAEL